MASKYLSQSAYARHRGLTQAAVAKAISAGRLTSKSVVMTRSGSRRVAKIRSIKLADAEWLANTDERKVTTPVDLAADGQVENEAKAHRRAMNAHQLRQADSKTKSDEAKLRMLLAEEQEKSGALVPVQEARDEIARVFTHVRTSLGSLASQAKQLIPRLTTADVEKLDRLVRESLEELADEEW